MINYPDIREFWNDRWRAFDRLGTNTPVAIAICILASGILIATFIGTYGFDSAHNPEGEPVAWFQGVSVWPSLGLTLFSSFLAIHFIFCSHVNLRNNAESIAEEFCLAKYPGAHSGSFPDLWSWGDLPLREARKGVSTKNSQEVDMNALWRLYLRRSLPQWRIIRAGTMTIFYIIGLFFLIRALESFPMRQPVYVRGESMEIFRDIRFFNFSLSLLLTFFVLDAILLHEGLLRILSDFSSYWPDETFREYDYNISSTNELRIPNELDISGYWDLLLIAKRTEAINSIVYYPFVCIAIGLLSYLSLFDNTPATTPLVIAVLSHCLLASYAAYRLPRAARNYREKILAQMRLRRRQLLIKEKKAPEAADSLIDEVNNLHQGAFVSIWEQPAIRAFLLPSGGLGLWTLLQYMPK
jgi:hypothetical protein